MFNARQCLRLFPTPTGADWLHGGAVMCGRLHARRCGWASSRPRSLHPRPVPWQATRAAPCEEDQEKNKGALLAISCWPCIRSFLIFTAIPCGVTAPVLQVGKRRLRGVQSFAQGSTTRTWWSRDSTPASLLQRPDFAQTHSPSLWGIIPLRILLPKDRGGLPTGNHDRPGQLPASSWSASRAFDLI